MTDSTEYKSKRTRWAAEMLSQGKEAMRESDLPEAQDDEWLERVPLKESAALLHLCLRLDALVVDWQARASKLQSAALHGSAAAMIKAAHDLRQLLEETPG